MPDWMKEARLGAAALAVLMTLAASMMLARGGEAEETGTPAAAPSACDGYPATAAEAAAEIRAALRARDIEAGLMLYTGIDIDGKVAGYADRAKSLVEEARRCRGYSDAELGLAPEGEKP